MMMTWEYLWAFFLSPVISIQEIIRHRHAAPSSQQHKKTATASERRHHPVKQTFKRCTDWAAHSFLIPNEPPTMSRYRCDPNALISELNWAESGGDGTPLLMEMICARWKLLVSFGEPVYQVDRGEPARDNDGLFLLLRGVIIRVYIDSGRLSRWRRPAVFVAETG